MQIEDLRSYLKSLKTLPNKQENNRVNKSKKDFYYFAKTYLNEHIKQPETSFFRAEFYKMSNYFYKKDRNFLFKAYRGGAKTTLISRFFVLWQTAIKGLRKNTIIISSSIELSKKTLEFIKNEIETNELLIKDFKLSKSSKWTSTEIIFKANNEAYKISVYGALKRIRGENWRGYRPNLIICDDLENDKNVKSKILRDEMEEWFNKAIMKLPSRDDTNHNIIVVGTTLHHDSLIARLEARKDFKTFSYPLVRQFPSSNDLKELVLDNNALDKKTIWQEYLTNKEAFLSEYQNSPLSKDTLTFNEYKTFEIMPKCEAYFIGIDPSLGKTKGDYFSIAILGYLQNKFYASVKMYKLKPTVMIDKILKEYIELLKLNRPIKLAIEIVAFQEFFKDELDARAKNLNIYLPIIEIKNNTQKELRIDALSPPINRGDILIDKNSLIFIDELDTYPKAAHCDGLDSLEMAWKIAKTPKFDYEKVNKYLKNKKLKEELLKNIIDQ